jgi:hypothetical protein
MKLKIYQRLLDKISEVDEYADVSYPNHKYSVWVGGGEVNGYQLNYPAAREIALSWIDEGYDDVVIEVIE